MKVNSQELYQTHKIAKYLLTSIGKTPRVTILKYQQYLLR